MVLLWHLWQPLANMRHEIPEARDSLCTRVSRLFFHLFVVFRILESSPLCDLLVFFSYSISWSTSVLIIRPVATYSSWFVLSCHFLYSVCMPFDSGSLSVIRKYHWRWELLAFIFLLLFLPFIKQYLHSIFSILTAK